MEGPPKRIKLSQNVIHFPNDIISLIGNTLVDDVTRSRMRLCCKKWSKIIKPPEKLLDKLKRDSIVPTWKHVIEDIIEMSNFTDKTSACEIEFIFLKKTYRKRLKSMGFGIVNTKCDNYYKKYCVFCDRGEED